MKPLLAPKEPPPEQRQSSVLNRNLVSLSEYASRDLKKIEKQRVACIPCQKAKAKCDGARPKCSRCIRKRYTECTYRERLHMREQLDALKEENEGLKKQLAEASSKALVSPRKPPISILNATESSSVQDLVISSASGSVYSDSGYSSLERSPRLSIYQPYTIPLHLSFPLHLGPYGKDADLHRPLSMSFLCFKTVALAMLAKGVPVPDVLGPVDVPCDLLLWGRNPQDTHHSACTWASEIARSFPNIDIYYRLAITYLLARYMRWSILPTAENFALIPDIMRPTAIQRQVPHHPCIDLLILPVFRDAVISNKRDVFSSALTAGVDLNWPYDLKQAVTMDPQTGSMLISKLFIEHISDAKNWKWGRKLLQDFPEVGDKAAWSDDTSVTPLIPGFDNLGLD